jgi:hypothetical protein
MSMLNIVKDESFKNISTEEETSTSGLNLIFITIFTTKNYKSFYLEYMLII